MSPGDVGHEEAAVVVDLHHAEVAEAPPQGEPMAVAGLDGGLVGRDHDSSRIIRARSTGSACGRVTTPTASTIGPTPGRRTNPMASQTLTDTQKLADDVVTAVETHADAIDAAAAPHARVQ